MDPINAMLQLNARIEDEEYDDRLDEIIQYAEMIINTALERKESINKESKILEEKLAKNGMNMLFQAWLAQNQETATDAEVEAMKKVLEKQYGVKL